MPTEKSVHQHNAIVGTLTHCGKKRIWPSLNRNSLHILKAALEIVMQQRKNYIEEILASISAEVQTLYSKLHPGEQIGQVQFFLNPRAIGSLAFDGQFQDVVNLPLQAYYSESHLDTLGICVFLALAKHSRPTTRSLSWMTFDFAGRPAPGPLHGAVARPGQAIRPGDRYDALPTVARSLSLGERFRCEHSGHQSGAVVAGQRPADRRVPHGSRRVEDDPYRSPLSTARSQPPKPASCWSSWLDFITLKYRCSIPRNARNEYTLGDLVGGVDAKLGK